MAHLSEEQREALHEIIKLCGEMRQDLKILGETRMNTDRSIKPTADPELIPSVTPISSTPSHKSLTPSNLPQKHKPTSTVIPTTPSISSLVMNPETIVGTVATSRITPMISQISPISTKPPEPPDYNQLNRACSINVFPEKTKASSSTLRRKVKRSIPLKYSCDELYERMNLGLCVFCDEVDTPDHYQLKHKGFHILVKERDDDQLFDHDETEELNVSGIIDDDKMVLKQTDSIPKQASYGPEALESEKTSDDCFVSMNGFIGSESVTVLKSPSVENNQLLLKSELRNWEQFSDMMTSDVSLNSQVSLTSPDNNSKVGEVLMKVTEKEDVLKMETKDVLKAMGNMSVNKAENPIAKDNGDEQKEVVRTRRNQKLLKSWRFKFKDKLKEHKLTNGLTVLIKQRLMCLSSITCLGLNGDNQMNLSGIAEDDKDLIEKFSSVSAYNKASGKRTLATKLNDIFAEICRTVEAGHYASHETKHIVSDVWHRWKNKKKILLLNIVSVTFLSDPHILVTEKNGIKIFMSCCYGSHYGSDEVNVIAVTFVDHSVCKVLLGAFGLIFLAGQTRDYGFFRFITQWKWHLPEKIYQAFNIRFIMLWTWTKKRKLLISRWLVTDTENKRLKGSCHSNKKPKEKQLGIVDASAESKTTTAHPNTASVHIKHVKLLVQNQNEMIGAAILLVGSVNDYGKSFFASPALPQYLLEISKKEGLEANFDQEVQCDNIMVSSALIQWKEDPPDQVLMLSSLRTRMFSTREYCDRNNNLGILSFGLSYFTRFNISGLVNNM